MRRDMTTAPGSYLTNTDCSDRALDRVERKVEALRLEHLIAAVTMGIVRRVPLVRPVLLDHGVPFQLVHHDDVATALVAGVPRGAAPTSTPSRAPGGSLVRRCP